MQQRQMELCIPKVSQSIPQKRIFQIFCKLNIGYISKITENPLRSDPKFKRVIIRLNWDNSQQLAQEMQEVLTNPKEHYNLVYDMPWYWQIYASHPQR